MSAYIEIANEMAQDFIRARNKKYALNKIIYDINHLIYSDTKELLSYKAKVAIMKYIYELLAGRRTFPNHRSEVSSMELTDIIIFFERRNFILKQLKTCIKQRARLN